VIASGASKAIGACGRLNDHADADVLNPVPLIPLELVKLELLDLLELLELEPFDDPPEK